MAVTPSGELSPAPVPPAPVPPAPSRSSVVPSPAAGAGSSPALLADGLAVDHPRRPPLAPPSWRTNVVVRLLALAAGAVLVAGALTALSVAVVQYGRRPGSGWDPTPALMLIVAVVVPYWAVGRLLERRRLAELAPRRLGGLAAGLALGFVIMCVVVGAVWALGGLRFTGLQTPQYWLPVLVMAGFQAAIVEEIAFRGVLFRLSEEVVGTWGAVALSAAVFGGAHLRNPHASILSALAIAIEAGVLFGALYALTRSLWVLMGVHFAWNVTQGLLFDIPVSGVDTSGLLRSQAAGPDLISGGAFGIEASLVTVVLMGAVSAWLHVLIARRRVAVAPVWLRRRRAASVPRTDLPAGTGGLGGATSEATDAASD